MHFGDNAVSVWILILLHFQFLIKSTYLPTITTEGTANMLRGMSCLITRQKVSQNLRRLHHRQETGVMGRKYKRIQ